MKILRISALSFIIFGATHLTFVNLLNPHENRITWYETALASSGCKIVYDTVTSASGVSSRKARRVCDPTPPPAPTPIEPVNPVKPILVSKPIDTEAPRIKISHPQNQAHVPYDKDRIQVSGSVLDNQDLFPSIKIYTAGLSDTLSSFGEVSLHEGQNDIHIRAEDKTHNVAEKIITVFQDSSPQPEPAKVKTQPEPITVIKPITPPQEIVVENETSEKVFSEERHRRQLIALEREKIIVHYLAQLRIQQLLNLNL